jgi:hypothetical protein
VDARLSAARGNQHQHQHQHQHQQRNRTSGRHLTIAETLPDDIDTTASTHDDQHAERNASLCHPAGEAAISGPNGRPELEEVNAYQADDSGKLTVIVQPQDFRLPDVLRHIEAGKIVLVIPQHNGPD